MASLRRKPLLGGPATMRLVRRSTHTGVARGRHLVRRLAMLGAFRATSRPVERHGTDYGGWTLAAGSVGPEAVVYSVGLGEDLSFECALVASTGCVVEAFDPTPRALQPAAVVAAADPRIRFHPWGIWDRDGLAAFHPPACLDNASFSLVNLQGTDGAVDAQVERLATTMQRLGHQRIDVLKMDIEGAEYDVLEELLRDDLPVKQIAVELHTNASAVRILWLRWVLHRSGFQVISRVEWDFTLLRL